MIEIVPLAPEHMEGFDVRPAPDQFGQAAVFVEGARVLAIMGARDVDGVAYVGAFVTEEARQRPVRLTREAKRFFDKLHGMGYHRIVAEAESERAAAWLRRLGFRRRQGAFEKCLSAR